MDTATARTKPTDRELVSLAQSGDKGALEQLARRWWPTLRRWAWLELGDAALAEDACQEALLRMVRFIGQCDPERPLEAWLRTILRNCARDQYSKRGRVFTLPEPVRPMAMDRRLDLQRAAVRARAAYRELTPRQREIIDLCENRGLTPTAAAVEMEIAPSTARALLHQARQSLRNHIADLHTLLEDV
jgi:RNA polymerase sigma-70 factor (ECF subfamily)